MEKSFLIKKDIKIKAPIYGSAFTGYIDTVSRYHDLRFNVDSQGIRYKVINTPPFELYQYAYEIDLPELGRNGGEKLVSLETSKKDVFKSWRDIGKMDNWQYREFFQNHSVGYDLVLSKNYGKEAAHKWMIIDLDRFFNITSKIVLRKQKCFALIKISEVKLSSYTYSNCTADKLGENLICTGVAIDKIVEQLHPKLGTPYYIINETGIDFKVDITFPLKTKTEDGLTRLRKALNKQGLDLVEVERDLKMLVISDK